MLYTEYFSQMYRSGYYLCVCDRPQTLVLTICGVLAICVAALTGVTLTAHMQAETVDDQDTLGINPYVKGSLHWLLMGSIAISSVFAIFLDSSTAYNEQFGQRQRGPPAVLTCFAGLSMLLCICVALSISSSLPIFVVASGCLAIVNGIIYSLAAHRSSLPSRRYTASALLTVLVLSSALLIMAGKYLATKVPIWGCPGPGSFVTFSGPPWACIDLVSTENFLQMLRAHALLDVLVSGVGQRWVKFLCILLYNTCTS